MLTYTAGMYRSLVIALLVSCTSATEEPIGSVDSGVTSTDAPHAMTRHKVTCSAGKATLMTPFDPQNPVHIDAMLCRQQPNAQGMLCDNADESVTYYLDRVTVNCQSNEPGWDTVFLFVE